RLVGIAEQQLARNEAGFLAGWCGFGLGRSAHHNEQGQANERERLYRHAVSFLSEHGSPINSYLYCPRSEMTRARSVSEEVTPSLAYASGSCGPRKCVSSALGLANLSALRRGIAMRRLGPAGAEALQGAEL